MSKLRDDKILSQLRKGNKKMFHELYLYFPMVRKMIISRGGSEEDAKDLFQNALIKFYKKALSPDFQLSAKISTYLYAIAQNQFLDLLRKKKKEQVLDIDQQVIDSEINPTENKSNLFNSVKRLLNELGNPCKELIFMHSYQGYSFTEIAEKLGYNNSNTAKQQKYKCLIRLRNMIPKELINEYYF